MDSLGAKEKCCKGAESTIFAPTTETISEPIAPRRSTRLTQTQNNKVAQMSASSTSTGSTQSVDVQVTKKSSKRKVKPGKQEPSTVSKAQKIREDTGQKILVNLDPEHGRPVEEGVSDLLSKECGQIVRKKCPMIYKYWRSIPHSDKLELRQEVKVNFEVDINRPSIKKYLNGIMGNAYREFKCELHAHYKKMRSIGDALANPPKAMIKRNDPTQWEFLCEHFSEEKFKKTSEINTKNRAENEYDHCGGSRPHGLYFQDKVKEGSKFPAIETFRVTHLKKGTNEWINTKAQEHYGEMILKEEAYVKELAEKHPGIPIEELPISPEVGIEILKDVVGCRVKDKRPMRGLGTFWGHETSISSFEEELEQVHAQLEREKATRGKIQGLLNDAYEQLVKLDPTFEAPQFDLEDDGDQ